MHEEALPEASSDLLASLTAVGGDEFRGWVLAGGTGLALQLGHRVSEDFDFFRTSGMDTPSLFDRLKETGTCEALQYGERTLSVLLSGVQLSFFQIGRSVPVSDGPVPVFRRCRSSGHRPDETAGGQRSREPEGLRRSLRIRSDGSNPE